MYVACKKVKSKWIAVARWAGGPDTCPAVAGDAFGMAGFNRNTHFVTWEDTMCKQKNFAGYAPDCQEVTFTPAEVRRYAVVDLLKSLLPMYKFNQENLAEIYPEYAEYIPEALAALGSCRA